MEKIQTVKIQNPEYGDTYTARIEKNGAGWLGQIQEVPEVKCEESTPDALLKVLKNELHEVLVARADAWDKQIEEDIKAGRLDRLGEKALEDLRAGRCKDL
jgi:hypothetical protein